jgi:hypothetical protein
MKFEGKFKVVASLHGALHIAQMASLHGALHCASIVHILCVPVRALCEKN